MPDDEQTKALIRRGVTGKVIDDMRARRKAFDDEIARDRESGLSVFKNRIVPSKPGGYKKGGKVKKTGAAKVHKGEFVIKKAAAKKIGPKKLQAMNRKPPARKPIARKRR